MIRYRKEDDNYVVELSTFLNRKYGNGMDGYVRMATIIPSWWDGPTKRKRWGIQYTGDLPRGYEDTLNKAKDTVERFVVNATLAMLTVRSKSGG